MNRAGEVYDVYLDHVSADASLARTVAARLEEDGLRVFAPADHQGNGAFEEQAREALTDARAVVLFMTRQSRASQNQAFVYGAAWGWNKPVLVLLHGLDKEDVPQFLLHAQLFKAAELDALSAAIQGKVKKATLSEGHQELLVKAYSKLGLPADQLLARPAAALQLTRRFNVAAKAAFSSEQLLQELLRMRKQGKLPRLRQPVASSAATPRTS